MRFNTKRMCTLYVYIYTYIYIYILVCMYSRIDPYFNTNCQNIISIQDYIRYTCIISIRSVSEHILDLIYTLLLTRTKVVNRIYIYFVYVIPTLMYTRVRIFKFIYRKWEGINVGEYLKPRSNRHAGRVGRSILRCITRMKYSGNQRAS